MKMNLTLLLFACLMTAYSGAHELKFVESTGKDSKLIHYLIPLPEGFVRFAELAREDQGHDVSFYFKSAGIRVPEGGRIAIDNSTGGLAVKLPSEEALRLMQLVNWCAEHSSARFFRGLVEKPDPDTAAADASMQFSIPEDYAEKEGIRLYVEKQSGDRVTCLIVNNTDRPTWFAGSSVQSPAHRLQELLNDRWTKLNDPSQWCGTGIRTPQLSPRRACRFVVSLPETKMPVRIGISLLDDVSVEQKHHTIWTRSVNHPSEQATASDGDKPAN